MQTVLRKQLWYFMLIYVKLNIISPDEVMIVSGRFVSVLKKQINIPVKWPLICIGIWFVVVYLFGCTASLCFINPIEALFCLSPLYATEILGVSVGVSFGLKCLEDKRTGTTTVYRQPIKLILVFLLFFAVAFFLECTLFQYNHYGVLFADGPVSTDSEDTDWSTLRLGEVSIGSENFLKMNFYFSLNDLYDGSDSDKTEVEAKISNFLHTPDQSIDKEYIDALEESERIIEEEGVDAAYPLPYTYDTNLAVARFNNLNRRIASVYIEPFFLPEENTLTGESTNCIQVMIAYSDEDNTIRQTEVYNIVDGMEYTRYIPLYPVGKTDQLSVCFIGKGAAFTTIKLNETIPLTPVLLRMLVIALIGFLIYLTRCNNLLSIKFNANSRKQGFAFMLLLALIFGYCLTLAVETVGYKYDEGSAGQYNHYLVDSIIEGRTDLNLPTSEKFESIDRKYDKTYWGELYGIDYLGGDVHWDVVYFQGKWFSYFGVVPAILLFVPYTLITGQYLPYAAACFIMGYVAILFLLLIWRRFYKRYLSDTPFLIYLLTSTALALGSFVPFLIRRSFFYETVNLGGLMFSAAGLYLLLRYYEKDIRHSLFTLSCACLCFALAVGCRPTMLFSSVLVPLFIWEEIKSTWHEEKTSFFRLGLSVAIPYIVVAIPLMWYNYIRFGSPFDFGSTYQVTGLNLDVQHLLNPIGKIYRALTGIIADLFNVPKFTTTFPYATVKTVEPSGTAYVPQYLGAIGLFTIPISWFILSVRKTKELRNQQPIIGRFVAAAIIISVVTAGISATYCVQPRYEIDYAWLVMLSALFCLYFTYRKCNGDTGKTAVMNRLIVSASLFSIIILFFISLRGEIALTPGNKSIPFYFYMKRAFSFFEGV